mgnify:CR=1 FL=1
MSNMIILMDVIQLFPVVLIGALIYYELVIFDFRRKSGTVIKMYGGGFLSRKAGIFHVSIIFFLTVYLLLMVLDITRKDKSVQSGIGIDYSNLFLVCCFLLVITNTMHVYISEKGILIGGDLRHWGQVKSCSVHTKKTIGQMQYLTFHLDSHKKISCALNPKKLDTIEQLLQSENVQIQYT